MRTWEDDILNLEAWNRNLINMQIPQASNCLHDELTPIIERLRDNLKNYRCVNALDKEAEAISRLCEEPIFKRIGADRRDIYVWWMKKKINMWERT
jgi:hypothetical protein